MKKKYESPFFEISHTSVKEIFCNETIIGASLNDENRGIIKSDCDEELDNW